MKTFKELGLNTKIMKGLDDLGFVSPSAIQEKAIPFVLESKKDLIALAQTGTGKTAAFVLPILNQIKRKALESIIICPTRELCLQISEDIRGFSKYSSEIKTVAVYGGSSIENQIRDIRRGVNIVVGTPGRLCDLIRRKVLKLQDIKWLVLDEADEMLDMGFKEDLDTILAQTPDNKRTLLFSATISKSVYSIAQQYMKETEEISVGEKNIGADKVSHEYYVVQARNRFEALERILDSLPSVYGILFCRTRNQTQEIADKLKQINYNAEALHGDISQNMRTKIMKRFKEKKIELLVATDVAARGIDINNLSHVINYNLPDHNDLYTHRSGRTGRAQNDGISISIITRSELRRINILEKKIGKKFTHKQLPSIDQVIKKQFSNLVNEIKKSNNENKDIKHLKKFKKELEKVANEDLIQYIINNNFKYLINKYQDNRDLNVDVNSSKDYAQEGVAGTNLKINLGKKQGFIVKDLFSLINSHHNLKGTEIGRIKLDQNYSIFSVEMSRANEVIKSLQHDKFKGIAIKVNQENGSDLDSFINKKRKSTRRYGRSSNNKKRRR